MIRAFSFPLALWFTLSLTFLVSACDSPVGDVYFELGREATATPETFFDFPYPSDLRLTSAGTPDLYAFPNLRANTLVTNLLATAMQHPGFPVVPVGYFRFRVPVPSPDPETVLTGDDAPLLLVDIDPVSPERGRRFPVVAQALTVDDFLPSNVLAIAPRPGFVLAPGRSYAFIVRTTFGTADGRALVPARSLGDAVVTDLHAPLWQTLEMIGVRRGDVAAATVFTTGDVVAELAEIAAALAARRTITIDSLAIDPDDGAAHPRYCELHGTVRFPQFQRGEPPFNTEGLFQVGGDGLPVEQRVEDAPITITIPKTPMPIAGYPLVLYLHGSGGLSTAVADRGPVKTSGGVNEKGTGPGHVVAAHGLAAASSAMPVNPERLPGAGEIAYLNFQNLAAFRDTFRQGVIEQRMFLDALVKLEIDPATLGACTGPSLPPGATHYRFDAARLLAQGQSMGGMYTNMVGATDPRIRAVVPTGAGGFWSHFIFKTTLVPGATQLITALLGLGDSPTFMHPAMHIFETASQAAEPMIYMPRLARAPLDGHPARPIYEPVGEGDSYFPTVIYDAIAIAYGNQQAGDQIWPTMQPALALDGRAGLATYPIKNNLTSANGTPYTGAVVQYEGDGIYDPHAIYSQLAAVKYQYGCFFASFVETGSATIPAPAPLGTPCPK